MRRATLARRAVTSSGTFCGFFDDEGQGAGPEAAGEEFEGGQQTLHERVRHIQVADVDNQGVPIGAIFGGENFADGFGIERVCAEAVDQTVSVGEGDESAVANDFRSAFDDAALGAAWGLTLTIFFIRR